MDKISIRRLVILAATVLTAGCGAEASPQAARSADLPPFSVERSAVHHVASASLQRSYEIFVKTPPGYHDRQNAGRRYPVLYLTDGPYTFQVASGVTRVPFNQGQLEEFILVGLSYAEGEAPASSRRRDYTPVLNPAYSDATGQAQAYLDHIETEVIPLVEAGYRADPTRRMLSGQSLGGLFGLWVAFTRPELFQTYILTSPSIWWVNRDLLKAEAAYAASHDDLPAHLYLATGSLERPGLCRTCVNDMVGDQTELVSRIRARGYPSLQLRADVIPDTIHEMTYPIALTYGLQWTMSPPGSDLPDNLRAH